MTDPLLITRQRSLLRDLHTLLADRVRGENSVDPDFERRSQATEQEFQENCHRVITRFESEKEAAQREFESTQDRVGKRFEEERSAAEKEWGEAQQRLAAQLEADTASARAEWQSSRTEHAAALKAARKKTQARLAEEEERIEEARHKAKQIKKEAVALLVQWRQSGDYGPLPPAGKPDRKFRDAFRQLEESLTTLTAEMAELRELRLPRLFEGARPFLIFPLCVLVPLGVGAALSWPESLAYGLPIGLVTGLAVAAVAGFWIHAAARSRIGKVYVPLCQVLTDVEGDSHRAGEQARTDSQRRLARAQKEHDKLVAAATTKFRQKRAQARKRHQSELAQAEKKYQETLADSTQRRDTELREAHEKYQKLRAEIYERYETDSHQIHERRFKEMSDSKLRHEREWAELSKAWHEGLARMDAAAREINGECDGLFPDWKSTFWQNWAAPTSLPPALPFGRYGVDLATLPGGLSTHERLKAMVATQFTLPGLIASSEKGSLLIKASDQGIGPAIRALEALMLRYLTSFPPGKVRFTIIDPVGLGESFGAFMHLADYDEALVTSRIWTELAHIEQRLSDLTGHMENVLQKYLRNQYSTIEEYNAQAGEVAEPFRILIVAHFPANFSAEAARRLQSIVASGARCGVYALILADTRRDLPLGFSLETLQDNAVTLTWQAERFLWNDADFEKLPLELGSPPAADFCTRLLHQVGEKARAANRVEVPFEFIAPPEEKWWSGDSRSGIDVALGRAGATKRQHLKLGQGTSQHVLLAGKTGSGKSTLLHALITNLGLSYSPDEVELYLIDFKKGVEFKTYAAHELPHARVVAIESDREFGLSVLQRLDAELRLRGERFRQVGAQDIQSFRELNHGSALPRIMLIVDEFQEFFIEDDKLSQDAAQLLDRLVRQGRAFGLHVLLGSQTLGGAYTLARSTIDQMAVRIALQCSEADAHLILSDDNSAARLLSRPGEAIYNNANGLVEGNNPFQVVWLPEERRELFLHTIRELERKHNNATARSRIVFEGNVLADLGKNLLLQQLLRQPAWPDAPPAFAAWLGEAIAIKDPTAAMFRRQSGSNLLLVGQHDEAARGILATALVSLAAQHPPADETNLPTSARFYILDGTPADALGYGAFVRLAELLPHPVQVVAWRQIPALLGELAELVDRRQKNPETEGPTIYLLLHGLQRFRDLRRDENDFSFSETQEAASPAKQFSQLIREGAAVGAHLLVWCDSLNNLQRSFDRQAMREFEMRVLFQMSAADSSTLIDSPLAGKLGTHRAFYHSEEEGRLEKFRPYGVPPESWLSWVGEQLRGKRAPGSVPEKV